MIDRSSPWKNALATMVRDPDELWALLELPPELLPAAREAAARFPLRVPRGFVARMTKGRVNDPLLRQILPLEAELRRDSGYVDDPVGDLEAALIPGMLQKYQGRVLLIATGACAAHCRYCFRRHYPYGAAGTHDWTPALNHIAADPSIDEVILSGGDPLMLDDTTLARLAAELETIPHLQRLRLHSRMPVLLPERVDDALLAWVAGQRLEPVMVIHANHPRELDSAVMGAMRRLQQAGVTLLNQAVLLRGVNDEADTLCDLSTTLHRCGVLPYYLHLLDRVVGAAHFDVPLERAEALVEHMRRRLPGYLVPRLAREQAGAPYKLQAPFTPDPAAIFQLN